MTIEQLSELLKDKSEEWRAGFFAAVNLNNKMKSAFLGELVGQVVTVTEEDGILFNTDFVVKWR